MFLSGNLYTAAKESRKMEVKKNINNLIGTFCALANLLYKAFNKFRINICDCR